MQGLVRLRCGNMEEGNKYWLDRNMGMRILNRDRLYGTLYRVQKYAVDFDES